MQSVTPQSPPSDRFVPWQLGVAAIAIAGGVFFALRAGEDFNRWVATLMWFAVGIIWIVLWRGEVRRRRRLKARAAQTAAGVTPDGSPGEVEPR